MPQGDEGRDPNLRAPLPLEEGVCYLVKGKSADSVYRLAQHRLEAGVPVVCVSRIHPDHLRARYKYGSAALWWISESPGDGHFDPTAVSTLFRAIEKIIEEHPDGCLLVLDGVESIAINVGFSKTLLFVEHLNEYVMQTRSTMLVPVDPECFEPTEFARLDRFTGWIMEEDLRDALDIFQGTRSTVDS